MEILNSLTNQELLAYLRSQRTFTPLELLLIQRLRALVEKK